MLCLVAAVTRLWHRPGRSTAQGCRARWLSAPRGSAL